ncbi:MAG: ApaG domain [Puniceicoccaceae bacterium]
MGQAQQSRSTPKGVFVTLDRLDYTYEPIQTPPGRPHVFTYHLTIHNNSDQTVTILARKWVLHQTDGQIDVIEGDKVVGKTPELAPGRSFSYASFHLAGKGSLVSGAFHGVDANGTPIAVPIPSFELKIPGDTGCS